MWIEASGPARSVWGRSLQRRFSPRPPQPITFLRPKIHDRRPGGDSVISTPVAKPEPEVPFEEAMQKLETIVEAMESGELPLESLMAKFEEGTRLAKVCQTRLAHAETKIQQLEKNAAGELTLRPVETNE